MALGSNLTRIKSQETSTTRGTTFWYFKLLQLLLQRKVWVLKYNAIYFDIPNLAFVRNNQKHKDPKF